MALAIGLQLGASYAHGASWRARSKVNAMSEPRKKPKLSRSKSAIIYVIAGVMFAALVNALFRPGVFEPWDVHVAVVVIIVGFIIGRRLSGARWLAVFSLDPNDG